MKKKLFIIAEAGVNHNGSLSLAKKLIDKAKLSGADAVKFQTWKEGELTGNFTKNVSYHFWRRLCFFNFFDFFIHLFTHIN